MTDDTTPHSNDSNHVRLKYLEAALSELRKDLFGNGQPGKLDKMEARTIHAMTEFNVKLSQVENKVGKIMIAIAVLGAASGAGATKVIQALLGVM
jgi:hypothetical protein